MATLKEIKNASDMYSLEVAGIILSVPGNFNHVTIDGDGGVWAYVALPYLLIREPEFLNEIEWDITYGDSEHIAVFEDVTVEECMKIYSKPNEES